MEEMWKDVAGYEGKYQVSNLGNVRSLHWHGSDLVMNLKPCSSRQGYLHIKLLDENHKSKDWKVHRLVALAFIPNPANLPEIHHHDEDKKNNRVDNLSWVTKKQNCNLGTRNERHNKAISKAVVQIDKKNGSIIARYDSITEATLKTGVDGTSISRVCYKRRKYKTAGGFVWAFEKRIS